MTTPSRMVEGADVAGAARVQAEVLGYLEPRPVQMRYAAFRAQGLSIGSGIVESATRRVVKARLSGARRRWAEGNVTPGPERSESGVGRDLGRVDVRLLAPDEPRTHALLNDRHEKAAEDLEPIAVADAADHDLRGDELPCERVVETPCVVVHLATVAEHDLKARGAVVLVSLRDGAL